jgi:hypothetical protein
MKKIEKIAVSQLLATLKDAVKDIEFLRDGDANLGKLLNHYRKIIKKTGQVLLPKGGK